MRRLLDKLGGDHPYAYGIANCILHLHPNPLLAYRLLRQIYTWAKGDMGLDELTDAVANSIPLMDLCHCIPSSMMVSAVRAYFKAKNEPDALAAFEHYIGGSGSDFVLDVSRWLKEDKGADDALKLAIGARRFTPGKALDVGGDLGDGGPHKTANWKHTLGGIDSLKVTLLDNPEAVAANVAANDGTATSKIVLRDPYEWHANDFRFTLCVHIAMENRKLSGGKDFFEVGEALIRVPVSRTTYPRLFISN